MLLRKIAAAAAALSMAGAAAAQLPAEYAPPPPLQPENAWHLDLSTGGRVTIQLRPDVAPAHVERIRALTRQGFYDGLVFHRVIDGFMAQSGDPTGTGTGGSPLPDLAAEFNGLPHLRGAVAMARTQEPNSANSQFYIMLAPRFSLDRQYTVFGRVVSGMAHVDSIERGEPPTNPSRILRAWIGPPDAGPPTVGQLRAAPPAPAPAPPPGAAPPPR
jgi:peptidylprolyl isomerase